MPESDKHELLYEASVDGDADRVRDLISAGADPNRFKDEEDGKTALYRAVQKTVPDVDSEVVSTLLKAGSDLNTKRKKDWKTALIRAADSGNHQVVATLLRAGADWTLLLDPEDTDLHRLAEWGRNLDIDYYHFE